MIQFRGLIQQFMGSGHQDDDSGYARCDIPPIATLQLENSTAKRDRALVHLLRLNHHTHSVLYSGYKEFPFHNHVPHMLGSAYLFGADDKQLHDIYEREDPDLEPWKDSPGEVTGGDWRRYLGDRVYQRAFLDFFEDEMVREGYDWKKVLVDYMLDPESPLLNSLICGMAHPLIHFGYAIELNSREVAMEALALAAVSHDYLHKYVELEISPPTAESSTDPTEILRRIHEDNRFDGICDKPGFHNQTALFEKREDIILKYYNQLDFDKIDLSSMMQSLALTTVLSLTTTHKTDNPQFDLFLCHALTSLYAVRTIIPTLPAKYHKTLIRSHWLFTLLAYLTQMRPSIKSKLLSSDRVDTSRGWDYINKRALERGLKLEPHYMKALRTMREFAKLYPKDNHFYLLAASKFVDEFQDWIGFEYSEDTLDIRT